MTRIIRVKGTDFCQFESFNVPLSKLGLTWVGGENDDTDSATSNGAGKSNFLKALGWCLFGQTPDRKMQADKVIRKGAKCCKVEVKLSGGWRVVRERRKGSPKLYLYKGDELVRDNPQARINEVVGCDWSGYNNTVFYSKKHKHFVHPDTSDVDKKKTLGDIIRLSAVDLALKTTKKNLSGLRAELHEKDKLEAAAAAELATYDLTALKVRSVAWEKQRAERLEKALSRAQSFAAAARMKADQAKSHKALEAKLERLQKEEEVRGSEYDRESRILDKAINDANAKISGFEASENGSKIIRLGLGERIEAFDSAGVCPTCSSPTSGDSVVAFVAGMKKKHNACLSAEAQFRVDSAAVERRVAEMSDRANKLEEAYSEATIDVAELSALQSKAAEAKAARERGRELVESARESKEMARGIKREENPLAETIELAEGKQLECEKRLGLILDSIKELSSNIAHWEFWKRGFGPQGMPSFMLDAVMPVITESTNKYLEVLADGDITVNFSTQRELASGGEHRDEIGVTWEIEGVADYMPSNGQWRKIEIASNFALMDLASTVEGSPLDIVCLDEVLDGLDAAGRANVVALLQKIRADKGTVLVVAHDSISEVFESAIVAVKRDGVSSIEVR